MLRPEFKRILILVGLVKLYGLSLLFILFLITSVDVTYTTLVFLRSHQVREERMQEIQNEFFERLCPWDGQFYLDIAAHGYRRFTVVPMPNVLSGNYAFFPLLPLLLYLEYRVLPESVVVPIAILINILLSAIAIVCIWSFAKSIGIRSDLAVWLLLVFPGGVFQYLLYTESIFMFLSVLTTILASNNRWGAAASLAYLCGLCRPQGFLVSIVLLIEWFKKHPFSSCGRLNIIKGLLVCSVPILGLATFGIINAAALGDPVAFVKAQVQYGRTFAPIDIVTSLSDSVFDRVPLSDIVGLLFGLGLLPFAYRRLPVSLSIYATCLVVLPLTTGSIVSMGRYISTSFPHFLTLAMLLERRPLLSAAIILLFVVLEMAVAKTVIEWRFAG